MTSRRNLKMWLMICSLSLALVSTATGATLHVNTDGSSGAYTSIQAAIDAASDYDKIEVAPDNTYNEAIDFKGKAIWLYSIGAIIDGGGAYHVVKCVSGESSGTVLEGFTITGGYASASSPDNCGGGMLNRNSSPTVIHCTFSGNTATVGGGMGNIDGSSPEVTNCVFTNNTGQYGGGMYNGYGSNPAVTDCTFSSNSANNGGGMHNTQSHPTVTNCTFSDNTAGSGGGMRNATSSPTVTNCTFSNNHALGGGMNNSEDSNPVVTHCTFTGNTGLQGGGMYNYSTSSPMVTNCVFRDNVVNDSGGVILTSLGTVTNCTFRSNSAGTRGGGIHSTGGNPTITNCILWSDAPNEISVNNSTPTVTYSDVQGGWAGDGNIDTDPLFADSDGRLSDTSPCIDTGDNSAVSVGTDLDGNHRIVRATVDTGAYEFQTGPIYNNDPLKG
jgi:predicted outer membrane repeat protein